MMQPYEKRDELKNFYLEDSFVLGFTTDKNRLVIFLEAILLDSHESYTPHQLDELGRCWSTIALIFNGLSEFYVEKETYQVGFDKRNLPDFGSIDALTFNGNHYKVIGDWGVMRFIAESIEIKFV
jgi:hypothetical protein